MSDKEEFLINTRQRRSNAGNRLKHLLELEELQQEELSQSFATEDDENVNLLFQEDAEDVEYSEEESSDEGEEREEEEEEDDENDDKNEAPVRSSRKRAREADSDADVTNVNEDDVFTDSDEESEESDAEEGEKELQLRERQNRRSKLKKAKQTVIPKIKPSVPKSQEPRKRTHIVDAASLLDDNRRSSSRKAVVENKLATVEKLKQLEERRKLNKPKERVEKYEMTQEERLLEAIETEKHNILSLNRFKEQELSKKERQRLLQQSRRKKLVDVIRFRSFAHYMTPAEELIEEQKLKAWIESRKEKRGRKKRVVEEESVVDKLVNKELLEKAAAQNNLNRELLNGENDQVIVSESSKTVTPEANESTPSVKTEEVESTISNSVKLENAPKADALPVDKEDNAMDEHTINNSSDPSNSEHKVDLGSEEIIEDKVAEGEQVTADDEDKLSVGIDTKTDIIAEAAGGDEKADKADTEADSVEVVEAKSPSGLEPKVEQETSVLEEKLGRETSASVEVAEESETVTLSTGDVKKVSFAAAEEVVLISATDELLVESDSERIKTDEEPVLEVKEEQKEEEQKEEEQEVHEGPEQLVSRNLISLESFDYSLPTAKIKEILLGTQSLDQAHRRSTQVEPLVRIKADTADDDLEKNLFKSFKDLRKQQFNDFHNLPKFGDDLSALHFSNDEEDVETVQEIKITTQAPVGIYLPNGMKKKCLITGKESQYFDPKNGLPYSSVEAYRVLQQVQNGEFAWCQFSSTGGCYLNDRNLKPANGCPERF